MSAQLHNPTDSLLYLQECLNDLQNRFYGLQLEQLQKHHQHAALEQAAHGTHQNGNIQNQFSESNNQKLVRVPSLTNSIWSHNPHRPPSTSSATTTSSSSSTSDRDSTSSSISSLRSFSPSSSGVSVSATGVSSSNINQEQHAGMGLSGVPATSIPTEIAAANAFNASAAAAASLEQFWNPSNIGLQYLTSQTSQLVQNEIQKQQQHRARQEQEQQKQLYISGAGKKGKIAPIGSGKPITNSNSISNHGNFPFGTFDPTFQHHQSINHHRNQQQQQQQQHYQHVQQVHQQTQPHQARNHHAANQMAGIYGNMNPKYSQKLKKNSASNSNSKHLAANKAKQGPFNKVLIVGLATQYRSLNGVLDIFRPYGDVVSARVYRPFNTLPPEITRWVPSIELQGVYCAIVEYPTARCAKFAVGVLRERVQSNNYRVVLLKPGAYEELQRQQTLIDSNSVLTSKVENQTSQGQPQNGDDSGNESLEQRSSRSSSDCHSD